VYVTPNLNKMGDVKTPPHFIIKYSIVPLVCNRNCSVHRTMKLTVVIKRAWCIHRNSKVILPDTAPLFVTPEAYAFAVPVP
jgi:hypothetical protein